MQEHMVTVGVVGSGRTLDVLLKLHYLDALNMCCVKERKFKNDAQLLT